MLTPEQKLAETAVFEAIHEHLRSLDDALENEQNSTAQNDEIMVKIHEAEEVQHIVYAAFKKVADQQEPQEATA